MLRETPEGTYLTVKVVPNARKSEVLAVENGVLKIRIAAQPEKGEANSELIRFLSQITGIPKFKISIIKGLTSKNKVIYFENHTLCKFFEEIRKICE